MSCSVAALRLHFFRELVAQLLKIDGAQVVRSGSAGAPLAGWLGADRLIDDPVQFLEQVGHVRRVAPFLQLLVDRLDVVVALGVA